jgi:predicted TPR repeat methyltransferase
MNQNFEKARDLFMQGVENFEAGRFEAAESNFQASLLLVPGRVSTLTNLAGTQIRLALPQAALDALDQALALEPEDQNAWWHRAIALGDLGQPEQALQAYNKVLQIDPGLALAWSNRGSILKDLRRPVEAAASFRRAIAAEGDAELNAYFLAAVEPPAAGQTAPALAPARYVQSLFDNYAPTFDHHLVEILHYQAHTVLVSNLQDLRTRRFRHALDLGCGTGLCGSLLQRQAERIDGVDLSPGMLEQARARGVYRRLVQTDLVTYLRTTDQLYDLMLAADVFIYIGDLASVFRGAASVMDGGGIFCFSAEMPDNNDDFGLKSSSRYGQSEAYLRGLAERHGFDVVRLLRQPLREDQQKPINGLYVYLRRR